MKTIYKSALALGMGLLLSGSLSAQELKIGVAGPLTGSIANFGAQLKTGAEQAAADINAKGGILGQKITLTFGDDQGEPKQGNSVANKLASEKVKFVIGHFNSGVSIPASKVYNEAGILQITPASTNPTYTENGLWNVFRTCGRDDQQGAVAGNYIATKLADKNVAVVHDKTPYGKGLADETKKAMNSAKKTEVMFEGVNIDDKDFAALVSKLKASKVDVVYFGGLHAQAGLLVRQMRDQGLKAQLISGDGIASNEFWTIAGPGAEGTLHTFQPDPSNSASAKDVVAAFKAKKINPEGYVLYSYAAFQVIAQAAEAAKSVDPKKVAEKIHSGMTFKTVIGDLVYNTKGDLKNAEYVFYKWSNGTYTQVK